MASLFPELFKIAERPRANVQSMGVVKDGVWRWNIIFSRQLVGGLVFRYWELMNLLNGINPSDGEV